MGTYKDGTLQLIEHLKNMDPTQAEDGKHWQLTVGDFQKLLPNKKELTQEALQGVGTTVEDKKQFAERIGKNFTYLYHIVNENKPHLAPRDLILCAVLLREQVPSAEETRHILMKVKREDLYTETYSKNENCRNLLLIRCLDHAHGGAACPTADWLVFTNSVICWFERKLSAQLGIHMEPLEFGAPDFSFVESHRELLQAWENQLRQIGFCYLMDYRTELIEAYMKKHKSKNKAEVLTMLGREAQYDFSYHRSVFGGEAAKTGSREMLIKSAIRLGCTLKQTNRLLRQAALPVLYPARSMDDAADAKSIHALRNNETDQEEA